MKAFMAQTANVTERVLSEEEWSQFVNSVDGLVSNLKELIASKSRRHPTSNWKKRQRRRPPRRTRDSQQSQSTPSPSPQPSEDVDSSRQSASSNLSQQNTSGSQQHKRNDRRRRAREASKYQRWYKPNRKRCIRNICGDNSPRCEIPLKDLKTTSQIRHHNLELPPYHHQWTSPRLRVHLMQMNCLRRLRLRK